MIDLLEDPDGAPYPEPVQAFVRNHQPPGGGWTGVAWRLELVDALESVAKFDGP